MSQSGLHIPGSLPPEEALEVLSMELRRALMTIHTYAGILADEGRDPANPHRNQAVFMILASSDNMLNLLEGIQDYLERRQR